MCGRYRLPRRKQVVEEYFDSTPMEHDWNPRYNIAPTQNVPIAHQNPKEPVGEMSFARWGLIRSWARDSSVAAKMINARSETASMKPAFRDAPQVPDSRGPVLQVEEDREIEAAILFRSQRPTCLLSQEFGIARRMPVATQWRPARF